ncbi:MAG: exocyst complex component Sec10-like protein [Piptocephalis tieghemiana]|nr:MAG: exocyst complex component Sec10-like protein [Piptocephalis tieghemiana]
MLKLCALQGKFDPDEFIEQITAPLIEAIPDDPKGFDPKPFVKNFESVTDSLMLLRSGLEDRIAEMEASSEKSHHQHTKNSTRMASEINAVSGTFEHLETQVAELGGTAIRVGERLETVDRQRAKAVEAGDIMRFWLDFGAGKNVGGGRLEEIRETEGTDGQFKAAVIARRLAAIAKDVDLPGQERARREIERYCEHFETSLLDEFSGAYEAGDLEHMSLCARVLMEYNGGASVTQHFINKHPFFIEFADMAPDEEESDRRASWKPDLPDWRLEPGPVDHKLDTLMTEVEHVVKGEWKAIRRVFPNAITILQTFVQRIFALTVDNYFSQLVERAERHSTHRQLRVLEASHHRIVLCTMALKRFDKRKVQRAIGEEEEGGGGKDREGVPGVGATLSTTLNRCEADLFSQYTDRDKYVVLERKALASAYDDLLSKFNTYMLQRKTASKGGNKLFRTLNQLTDNARGGGKGNSTSPSMNQATLAGGSSTSSPNSTVMEDSSSGSSVSLVTAPEEDGQLQVDLVVRMLMVHAESVGRCRELSSKGELPRNLKEVFRSLLLHLHDRYVDVALDASLENLQRAEAKGEADLTELRTIVTADRIARLTQKHFEVAILPCLTSSPIILREVLDEKNKALGGLESKANEMMQRMLDGIIQQFTNILSKQGKTDFKPKDQEIDLISLATTPCNQSVDYLRKIHTEASKWMAGRNLEVFLTEVGVTFHGMLLEHFRKFPVSPTGALSLSKDISKYQEAVDRWGLRVLSERFEMLRELGNVFLVKPEILRMILEEGQLAQIGYKYIKPFLKMREDWASAKKVLKQSGDNEDELVGSGGGGPGEDGMAQRMEMASMMRM